MSNKAGRPARPVTSYRNEIQRLKKQLTEEEKNSLFLKLSLERYVDKVMSFEMSPLPKRIKKAIRGKL